MSVSLPVVNHLGHEGDLDVASRACSTCHGGCCVEYSVPLGGYDLIRLARGRGLPWDAIATVEEHRVVVEGSVRLDRGPVHTSFVLRRRPTEACIFLVEVMSDAGLHRRCGVHALRPDACRIYPAAHPEERGGVVAGAGAIWAAHAICPPPQKEIYRAAIGTLQPFVDEDAGEQALYARILGRWDQLAARTPQRQRIAVAVYVAWLDALYQSIEPLRRGGPRSEWQPNALALVDDFPLPR